MSTVAPGGLSGYTAPSGSGDITVNSAIAKTAGGDATLTLRADRNIAVNQSITSTSGALGLTLSAANNASGALGGVRVASGVTLDSNGGKILIGGAGGSLADAQTLSNGIGYALNASASLEAVSIGSSARVLSRGGDITINGYSTQPKAGSNDTTGVRIGASAIIDSGYYAPGAVDAASGGYINISGKYAGPASTVFGVKIENPSGNSGQTTLSASTTTGSIRIEGSSTYDVDGSYALNMATGGLAGNIYFNAYSVADLIFILNGGLKGVVFTYSGPNSGCRSGYPNCGLLSVTSSANNSYLYATYNAVNMATRPIYVSATLTGTKVYDGTLNASGLSFSNIAILDPASSGYLSSSVTSASYVTPSANVGEYSNLSASSLSRNYSANGNNYVVGYNFTVSPSYAIMPATAYLSAVKTYDGNASFTPAKVTASGVNGETLSLTGSGPATANSPDVVDNATNYLTAIGDLMLANGVSGTQGLASNYVLPSLAARSAHNIASITPVGLTVLGVGGSKNYDGTASFSAGQLSLGSGVVDGDIVQLAGSAAVASKDIGAYTQWASSNLSLTGSGASNYTLIGGAVSALINPAPLGIAVNAIYNGTTSFTHGSGATLTTAGLIGAETVTGVTVSDANVDAVTAAKFVTGVTGGNGFVASNYVLYGAGTPAYNQSLSGGNITTSNNTSSIAPAPLGIAAAPTYNGTTAFATTAGVASGGTGSLVTGGSVSVAGLVNGHTLAGFSLDSANVASAGKVTDATLGGGIDARNYVLNGSVFGSAASVSAGALADGSAATNVASLAAAPLGIAVNATYNGTTSFTHGSGAILTTAGLIGAETVTGVTVSDANVDAVTAAKFVTSVTGSNGFLASNYVLYGAGTPAYNQSLSGGSITTSNNTASLTPAPLGVAVSGAYNGSTVLSSAEGATIAGYGLVGQDAGVSLTTATLNAKNVSEASKVVALTGTGSFDQRNYVLNGAVNTAPGTAGVVLDGSGATNTAALSRAALGVAVSGTYNGSTSFDSTNATLTTNGLVGGDTLIGVTVNDANVVGNGGNYITAFTGGTASLSNYRISGSIDTTTTGAGISTTHNSVTLRRAPLGVAVSGTYNGSTSFVQGLNGTTIAAYGLVGQDVNVQLTSATLASRNAGTNRVVSIAGPAGFEPANYVLDGSVNTTPATAGTASDGSGATNAATIGARALTLVAEDKAKTFGQPDPEFTYQVSSGALLAGDALLGQVARRAGENLGAYPISAVGLANGNYAITAIDGTLTIVAPVEPPPPPTPIIVPAFIDNGMSALSSGVVPATFGGLNYVPASGGQAGAQGVGPRAPGNAGSEPAATPRSALNFVASSSAEASPAAASGATNGQTGNGPTAERRAPTDAGSEQAPAARSSLNFVADSSTEGAPEAAAGGTRKAARELNVNNVTVPSSSGPLDVFVIDSGINTGRLGTLNSLNN